MRYFQFRISFISGILLFPYLVCAQITEQQVDTVNRTIFPLYTNIYTFNSPTMFQIPNGDYTFIYTSAAGHHTDSTNVYVVAVTDHYHVTPEQQYIADNDPLRHIWVYDREQFIDEKQYADSLHGLLSAYFTITNYGNHTEPVVNIYPNPANNYIKLNINQIRCEKIRVHIINCQGIIVWTNEIAPALHEISNSICVRHLPPGQYWFQLEGCHNIYNKGFVKY